MRRFDLREFHNALDTTRRLDSYSWEDVVRQINMPFTGTPSIPISVETVRGMLSKRSVTSAVKLQALRWLKRSPESFLSPAIEGVDDSSYLLPEPGMGGILWFDTAKLFNVLDSERAMRGATWRQVALELPSFKESMLRNLKTGPLIGFHGSWS